jgi:hypothetical protein
MSKEKPDTVATGATEKDTVSDPGKGAEDRSDWADEGGATSEGPATDTDADTDDA